MAIIFDLMGRQASISSANDAGENPSSEEVRRPLIRPGSSPSSNFSPAFNSPTGSIRREQPADDNTTSLDSLGDDHKSSSSEDEPEIQPPENTAGSSNVSSQSQAIDALASQPTYTGKTDGTLAGKALDIERRREQKNNLALIAAVKASDWGAVRKLIQSKVVINRPDPDGYTALHHAVMLGDLRMAHLLLDNGAKKEATTRLGYTALMLAASKRLPHLVELLAEHRIGMELITGGHAGNLHRTDRPSGWTSFHESALSTSYTEVVERLEAFAKAVQEGDIAIAARMIASGSMAMDESDGNGDTPLVIAATTGNVEMIRLLLCNGAKTHSSDRSARSPLICAAANRHFAAIQVLLTAKADPLQADIDGKNALDHAVDADDADLLKALLGGMNAGGGLYKHMPVFIRQAAVAGKLASVRMLLAMHADLPDARGCLALAVMATSNQLKAVQTLLTAGADLHHRDRDGHTAFTLAAANGHVDIINALFAYSPGPLTRLEWIRTLQNETDNDARSGLMLAALNRQRQVLLLLIKQGAEILKKDRKGRDAMWWAAAKGGQDMVTLLQSRKANLFVSDMNGNTLFHAAAENGAKDVIELYSGSTYADTLLNINAPNKDGDTPLILAARHGHLDVVNFLLSENANVLHENKLAQTALHEAGAYGHAEIYALLSEKEERLDKVYPFMHAVCDGIIHTFPLAKHLLPEPRKPGSPQVDRNGNTVTHRAAENGRTAWLGKMLADQSQPLEGRLGVTQGPPDGSSGPLALASSGAVSLRPWSVELEMPNNEGLTPLCLAIRNGHFETVSGMVKDGSNVNFASNADVTPLWLACRVRALAPEPGVRLATTTSTLSPADLVQLLLDHGAVADAPSFCGQTPLAAASATGEAAMVQRLIRAGADVHHVDDNGLTALMLAAHLGHVDIAAILLNAGAAPDPNPAHGKLSALLLAAESGRDAVIKLLVERGAQKDRKHDDGATALTVASAAGNESTVALLIELGANLFIQDSYGKTAMDYAKQGNHYSIIVLLQDGYPTPRDC